MTSLPSLLIHRISPDSVAILLKSTSPLRYFYNELSPKCNVSLLEYQLKINFISLLMEHGDRAFVSLVLLAMLAICAIIS